MGPDAHPEEALVERLRALASPVRLQILRALVSPTRPADVRVRAAGERAGLGAERMLGRSTVIEHLDVLEQARLVRRIGDAYAVDQQAMVALLQDLSELARLRALIEVDVESTRPRKASVERPMPPPPRLVIVDGPEAGRAIALAGGDEWQVGRAPTSTIALSHDPHVSRLHLTLRRAGAGFVARVAEAAKNGAEVDFAHVPPGASVEMRPGAVLSIGATTLVFQA